MSVGLVLIARSSKLKIAFTHSWDIYAMRDLGGFLVTRICSKDYIVDSF